MKAPEAPANNVDNVPIKNWFISYVEPIADA